MQIISLILMVSLVGCGGIVLVPQNKQPKSETIIVPPAVEKTRPAMYPLSLDPKPWMNKTLQSRVSLWFRITEEGWYIDWSAQRLPLLMVIIHHSFGKKDATADDIEKINKDKIWDPYYQSNDPDPYLKGLEPHTGYCVNGKERFICYHHLVYWDGRITTELQPLINIDGRWYIDTVVWHAGDMTSNRCGISICLVGDFTKNPPAAAQLKAVKGLIAYYKQFNQNLEVLPHKEVCQRITDCPGDTWDLWGPQLK